MNAQPTTARDGLLLAGLCGLLLSIYLFTFSGRYISDDELYLLDTAESLARRGSVLLTETGALKWPGETQEEPVQPLLGAALFRLADALPFAGNVHTVMLFNPLVTTATAALVYLFVLALGYRRRVALTAALAFGLGTIAWPYTRNFFREPLTGLMLFATAYLLLRWRVSALAHAPSAPRWLAASVVLAGLSAITKETALLALPLFALVFVPWSELRDGRKSQLLQILFAAAGVVLLVAGSVWFYQTVLKAGLDRFIRDFNFWGLDQGVGEALTALVGLLASPGKSLFLYSPVLALAAAPLFARPANGTRRLDLAWPLALLALFVVVYALARGDLWWGGTGWGPRYMVPLAPFLIVAAAPAFDYVLRAGASLWARLGMIALFGLSLLVQVAGVAVFPLDYYEELQRVGLGEGAAWTVGLWNPYFSAILTHWRLIATNLPDFAWARALAAGPNYALAALLALFVVAFAALLFLGVRRAQEDVTPRMAWAAGLATLGAALLLAGVFLGRIYPDQRYRGDDAALHEMRRYWAEAGAALPDKALFLNNMTYFDFMLNYSKDPAPFYTLPLSPNDRLPPDTPPPPPSTDPNSLVFVDAQSIVDFFPHVYRTTGLLMETGWYQPWVVRSIEWWMAETYYNLGSHDFSPEVRLITFSTARAPAPADPPAHASGALLGDDILLAGYDVAPEQAVYHPGDILNLSLVWQARAMPAENYTVSVDLIGAGPTLILQHDSYPVSGFWPTVNFVPGTPVRDNVAFVLPPDLAPGTYEVWVLMYDSAVQRLPVTGPDGAALGDHLVLFSIQVQ